MNYLAFNKAFAKYPVFSVKDINKQFPDFDNRRLLEWQLKRYLIKIRRGYYCFEETSRSEELMYLTANKIYSPSYISLESALAYYNFIPEGVFITTSVTTMNTANYETNIGNFKYRHFRPKLFFGYRLLRENQYTIRMAEPEKVILDYFYFNTLNTKKDIAAMRLNKELIKDRIDLNKLNSYQAVFNSRILTKRIQIFLKVVHA
jgi:predicted transcriptional regulator of viral defense system